MSLQKFILRWNNHANNLVQDITEQYEQQSHVDVTISCQGRFIKAHKIVLGACSPYFHELFNSHESTSYPIIIINGYNFDDIRSIVDFMYRGEVMVAETCMQRLLSAAEDLQIKGLSSVISKSTFRGEQQQQQNVGSGEEMGGYIKDGGEQEMRVDNHSGGKERVHPPLKIQQNGSVDQDDKQQRKSNKIADKLVAAAKVMPSLSPIGDHTNKNIRGPPKPFRIFANEWGRQLAGQFPNESSKEITARLMVMWKNMRADAKAKYINAAR